MKKIIVMLAGAAMMVSCGGNQTQEESSTIKVGGMGPLTGSAAMYGTTIEKGAKLAFEEINMEEF